MASRRRVRRIAHRLLPTMTATLSMTRRRVNRLHPIKQHLRQGCGICGHRGNRGVGARTMRDGVVMSRLSMLELGRRLGVDRATVSRALSEDKAHLVAEATRDRIRAEASRLGFSADVAAATLRRGRSRTIGILTPDLLNEVLGAGHSRDRGLSEPEHGRGVAHHSPDRRNRATGPRNFGSCSARFLARRVDAIISLASTEQDAAELSEAAKQVPVVLAVRSLSGARFPSALCDDRREARWWRSILPLLAIGSSVRSRGRDARRRSRIARKASRACAAARSSWSRRAGSR